VLAAAPQNNNATSKRGKAVHSGAEWMLSFSCAMHGNGCPGEGLIMRMPGGDKLLVRFKADCSHVSDGQAHGQARGDARLSLQEGAGGRSGAWAHSLAAAGGRSVQQQLDNDASSSGASGQVVRQAQYEARKKLYRFHADPLLSLVLRERAVSASDAAATPAEDLPWRLWLGDMAPMGLTLGSEVLLLTVTDEQMRLWQLQMQMRLWQPTAVGSVQGLWRVVDGCHRGHGEWKMCNAG